MEDNRKKLIELRTKVLLYKDFDSKIQGIMNDELDLEELQEDTYLKLQSLEKELSNYKMEIDLPDEEWDEDEILN